MEKSYARKGALPGHSQPIEFQSDDITLDIPMEGITLTRWTISPLFPPVVRDKLQIYLCTLFTLCCFCDAKVVKKKVDSFEPGKMIPSCQLCAEFSGSKITPFKHHVKLLGAKKPYDSFLMKPPASIFTGATKSMPYMDISVTYVFSLKLCVTCTGVAVMVERSSDEIIEEGTMATHVS